MARLRSGDRSGALDRFRLAAKHCGGIYLHSFLADGYDLTAEQQHWEQYQRVVLHHLLQLSLDLQRLTALPDAAERLRHLGEPTREDCLLLAEVYAALGAPQLARAYQRRAEDAF